MNSNNFLILGGDKRALSLGEYLEHKNFSVCYYGFNDFACFSSLSEALEEVGQIILPLPFSRDRVLLNTPLSDEAIPLAEVSALAKPGQFWFGGQLTDSFCEELTTRGAEYCDYFLLDELAVYNAVPTAEGVVGILIDEAPKTVRDMNVALLGYGRVGKILCSTLLALGAHVTVFARREKELAFARVSGASATALNELVNQNAPFDALVNTIPFRVLGEKQLAALPGECLLIEIASAPFGIDFQAAKEAGFRVIKAGSLPGKVAPQTAGEIIGRCILPILENRGLNT